MTTTMAREICRFIMAVHFLTRPGEKFHTKSGVRKMKGGQPGNATGSGGISRDTGSAVAGAGSRVATSGVWITHDKRGILPVVSTK